MRLYHLAKELQFPNQSLMEILAQLGQPVRSHLSPVEEHIAEMIRNQVLRAREKARSDEAQRRADADRAAAAEAGAAPVSTATPETATAVIEPPAAPIVARPSRAAEMAPVKVEPVPGRVPPPRLVRRPTRVGAVEAPPADKRLLKKEAPKAPAHVVLTPPVTVKDLSVALGLKVPVLIKKLMEQGMMARINDPLPDETLVLLGVELGVEIEVRAQKVQDVEADLEGPADAPETLLVRAPIVAMLGHVDHGKTSLLDRIREAHVAADEPGGITQHIGAYRIKRGDHYVTFLDTPGHEAFTEMRARGAHVTDIVVLVVAADDGVMPQTEEAVSHARAAGVPIVVALNKIDKKTANPMKVKQQLSALGLQPEEWGGQTIFCEVSALTGQGVENLLDMLALQAEVLELKVNPERPAKGTCLEAKLTEGRGVVATFLVQTGTLKKGDIVLCGAGWGKIRALVDDRGREAKKADPATPVEVQGLSDVPDAGDRFYVLEDPSRARSIAETRQRRRREEELGKKIHVTLETLRDRMTQERKKEVRIILKADVKGSLEVLEKALADLATDEVKVHTIHEAVGGVNESDVLLADASDAIVIGFQVVPDEKARSLAESKGISIRYYDVIYTLLEEMRQALEGILEPEEKEQVLGFADVRETFRSSAVGMIAGLFVTKGKITRQAKIRLIREGHVIYKGDVSSLRRFKEDVTEVKDGYECGIKLKNYDDVKKGDRIEAYEIVKVARTL